MSDQRFKELLNLYLDHRLSDAEAGELEQCLRADARRRKVLRDYSLIEAGCSELFTRAASQAPSSAALCRSLRTVEARMARADSRDSAAWSWREWSAGWGLAGAGLAACAAVFVIVRSGGADGVKPVAVAATSTPPAAVRLAEPVSVAPAPATVSVPAVAAVVERVSERQKARNLTLAALGLTMDEPALARGGKQWAEVRETYELANLSPSARSWIIATAGTESGWNQAQSTSLTMQTGLSAGYQVESAGYRFER
jgi:hypothetical protein